MDEIIEKQTELLKKCLNASLHGKVGIFLYETKVKEEEILGEIIISQKIVEKCKPVFKFTKDYVYLNMEFEYEKEPELLSVNHMLEMYLNKYTNAVVSVSDISNQYTLVFDVSGVEDGITYTISCVTPIFFYKEDSILKFVFDINYMNFGCNDIDYEDIDNEIEYEERVRREEINHMESDDNSDDEDYVSDDGDFISEEDFYKIEEV